MTGLDAFMSSNLDAEAHLAGFSRPVRDFLTQRGERDRVRGEPVRERVEAPMHQPPELTHEARLLRRAALVAETHLWPYLRNRRLEGHKIRRGRPVGDRVVSFYVAEARLAVHIELDARMPPGLEAHLAHHTVRLLPLSADRVLSETGAVLRILRERLAHV